MKRLKENQFLFKKILYLNNKLKRKNWIISEKDRTQTSDKCQ